MRDGVGNSIPKLMFKMVIQQMTKEMMQIHKQEHMVAMQAVFDQIKKKSPIVLQAISKPTTPWSFTIIQGNDARFYEGAQRYYEGDIFGRVPGWGKSFVKDLDTALWGNNVTIKNKHAVGKLRSGVYFHR